MTLAQPSASVRKSRRVLWNRRREHYTNTSYDQMFQHFHRRQCRHHGGPQGTGAAKFQFANTKAGAEHINTRPNDSTNEGPMPREQSKVSLFYTTKQLCHFLRTFPSIFQSRFMYKQWVLRPHGTVAKPSSHITWKQASSFANSAVHMPPWIYDHILLTLYTSTMH